MDFLQFLPASLLPNVAQAVKEFGNAPKLSKPAKQKVDGTLGEITVRSMDNCVGLITYAIAKCWALGNHGEIPELAQQLQIEVDSLKNVERADREYVARVLKSMSRQKVYWLSDKDNLKTFTEKPISVCGDDTISHLAAAVNAVWKPALFKERSLIEFIDLFPNKFPEAWLKRASRLRDEYMARIKSVNGDKHQIIEVIKHYKEIANGLKDYQKFPAACSFWRSCHVQKSGTASLVFHMFKEEIKQQLAIPQFGTLTIVGGDKNDYAGHKWTGVEESIQIVDSNQPRFKGRFEVRIGERFLGLLATDSAKYPSGTHLRVFLKTYKSSIFARVI